MLNYRGISWCKFLFDAYLYMGRIYAFLVRYQSGGPGFYSNKYVNHSHNIIN